MSPRIEDVYAILKQWAIDGEPQSYSDLSKAYHKLTDDWFEPHGSWDNTLGTINNRLSKIGAPALSVLVILKEENEPGGEFWGSAPNVPERPRNELARVTEWNRIVKDVCAYDWPELLP